MGKTNSNKITIAGKVPVISAKPEINDEYIGHLVAIVENSEDAIISKSLTGIIRTWNKGGEKMFGYPAGEAIGQHISLIIPAEYENEEKRIVEKIRSNESISHYETIRKRKDGTQLQVSLTVSPIKDKDGIIIGISKIARDITLTKTAASNLIIANSELIHQNEEKEKRAAELVIANTELTYQNEEKEKRAAELAVANKELMFQNKEKEKRAAELVIANKELLYQNKEKEKRAAELVIANKELTYQNKEKEKRAAHLVLLSGDLKAQQKELRKAHVELHQNTRLLWEQEEKLILVNDDLTSLNENLEKRVFDRTCELENLNVKLKELNVSKDKFLSVISHDLRNPLTALLASSDYLFKITQEPAFEKITPLVEIIQRTSRNILQQLTELVEWAQTQRQSIILNSEKLHLSKEVEESLELLKDNVQQKNIVLENNVDKTIYVNADTFMLRSVLQNLVTNAIKYTPQGGRISIAAHMESMVAVTITDSGTGMDANTRENLFTTANFASAPGTDNEKGSGLGLILVKDFITQHGGTLGVQSELGKGTTITFTLPK